MNRYLVMTYSPQLKGKAKQYGFNYLGVRVVETTDGQRPNSSRAKNVVRVVEEWGGVPMGQTLRSKGVRVMVEAKALAAKLNQGE